MSRHACRGTTSPRRFESCGATNLVDPLGLALSASRFCDPGLGYSVLYAAPSFETSFVETVVRDRFARKSDRSIPLAEIAARGWLRFETRPGAPLALLDLRGAGCLDIGAPSDAVSARNHAAGRALGRVIHLEHEDIDGILYSSWLTGADCYAIFDRAVAKLDPRDSGLLYQHSALPTVLERFGVSLTVD